MDKSRKLRRYSRKNYTQMVEFPVEIVGRDGVVRRYTFEESIRLYQRRIASADARYPDADLAGAERTHCQRRIEQLRKSYDACFGWTALDSARDNVGTYVAEVAAFLRRCLNQLDAVPEQFGLDRVDSDELHQVFFAYPRSSNKEQSSYLLYFYTFTDAQDCKAHKAFSDYLSVLQKLSPGTAQAEQLVSFHKNADCGLILTGQGHTAPLLTTTPIPEDYDGYLEATTPRPNLLRQGMVLLERGDQRGALRQFTAAYEANPYNLPAYIAACAVAEQMGRFTEAELTITMGLHYFPDSAVLHYFQAILQLRKGNMDAAAQAMKRLQDSEEIHPAAASLLNALIVLHNGRFREGKRLLRQSRLHYRTSDALASTHRWVWALLAARNMLRMVVCIMTGVGMVTFGSLSLLWGAMFLPMLLLLPAIQSAWKRQYTQLLSKPPHLGVPLADPAAITKISSPPS